MNDPELNRLRWRCRRGMLELDAWLGDFLESGFSDLDEQGRAVFACLLEHEDPELYAWLSGRVVPPDAFSGLVAQIRNCMVIAK